MKYRVVRWLFEIATKKMRIFKPEMAPIKVPNRFELTHQPSVGLALESLIRAYQTVFKEASYWAEIWSREAIQEKLEREVDRQSSFLVTMLGDKEMPIAGFAWGEILAPTNLGPRIAKALQKKPAELDGLIDKLLRFRITKLVYADEFAIVARFRSGIEPVRGLLQPWLEWAWLENQVFSCLFWTTPASPIYKLGLYMGFEPVFWTKVEEKDIVFILNRDFRPLLKICQNMNSRQIARILMAVSRRRRRK
ncbi:hypothetical protein L6250_01910 [Candidatus Parcubacteria bacterium]|nr:hypothetical protein [Patescibacteria group bacterium]MBU4466794.1 hypothetical protein [Patescibacteria group bacterium]MCG2688370.1 hypothetical protein [Candidatus Parcubacteria bacterium]